MKNKNYYERKNHVKDALRLEGERFVKKINRNGKERERGE